MTAPRVRAILLGIVVLAVLLRVPTLGAQSLWADEAATVDVLDRGLGDLYGAIRDQESTPPLFYVLAWLVAQVAGLGEFAVRIVPAVAGIATVPVAGAIGLRLGGPRVGLAAALLVATNPLLVWFSQEARAYSLLVLLCALSVLLLLRVLEAPQRPGRLLAWGLVVGLACATHYFAAFLAATQAVWLLVALRREGGPVARPLAVASVPAVTIGLALVPMFLEQRSADRASFISEEPFGERALQVPKQFLVGYDAPAEVLLTILAAGLALLTLGALILAARAGRGPAPAGPLAAVAVATVLVPFAFAAVGDDYVITRNLLPALAVVVVLMALGTASLPSRAALAVAAGLGLIGAGTAVAVQATDRYQREDWRAAIRSIESPAPGGTRLLVVAPGSGRPAALLYADRAELVPDPSAPVAVSEIAVVAIAERRADDDAAARVAALVPPPPGFVPVSAGAGARWRTARYVATPPVAVVPQAVAPAVPGAVFLLEP